LPSNSTSSSVDPFRLVTEVKLTKFKRRCGTPIIK
jgi:hypothetical protein